MKDTILKNVTPRFFFWDIKRVVRWALLVTSFHAVSSSAYYSTLKMEAICSFETSVDFQLAPRRYIPEDRTLHNRENLK
jgi:hypothetical protein